jgi:hypothetical protein
MIVSISLGSLMISNESIISFMVFTSEEKDGLGHGMIIYEE